MSTIECPFCKKTRRDLTDLKSHLQNRCNPFAETEGDAFSLTPAMVQARNDQLNDQVEALKARAATLEEALREVLSGCKRCGGDGATLERPWAGAEHELNSCPDCGKYRELLSSPAARDDGWVREPLKESGVYWWWNEDEDSEPIPVHIACSGTDGTYFAMDGQYGWNRFQTTTEMGGWWMLAKTPTPPTEGGAL